jgi:hypothetical protein
MPARALAVVALTLLALAGCGPAKLDVTKSFTLEDSAAQVIDLDPQPKPQTVTVEFTSSAGEVYVYLIKDFKKDDGLDAAPKQAQTLASKLAKEGTISADVGEKTPVRVAVRNPNAKTEVTVKVTNKK